MVRLALLIEHLLWPKHTQNSVWQPPELNYNFWVRHSKFSQMQLYFHSNSCSTLPDPTSETILLCVVHRHVGFRSFELFLMSPSIWNILTLQLHVWFVLLRNIFSAFFSLVKNNLYLCLSRDIYFSFEF